VDAFYASVEQRDNPALKGKPVAVGYPAKRGVVVAASYEARGFGVRSAMPSMVAMRKCSELIFVPPRFEVYRAVSRQIHAIFKDYTPLVELLSLDEAHLDVTDNIRGIATAWETAKEIRARIYPALASCVTAPYTSLHGLLLRVSERKTRNASSGLPGSTLQCCWDGLALPFEA
jgi:DNA polymerase IV